MNIDVTCQWWITFCDYKATWLILACCPEGHIHERLLCGNHRATFIKAIEEKLCICTECPELLVKYLDKTPVENHWNLSEALSDHPMILISFLDRINANTAPWSTIPPAIPGWRKELTYGTPVHPIPPFPVDDEKIREAYQALRTPADPGKLPDNPVTSWIKKNFRKKN